MISDGGRPGRPVGRIALVAILALVLLLVFVARRRAASDHATGGVGADDAADEAPSGWRRLFGVARAPAPLPTWRLDGRVVDSADRPVAGATVVLARPARTTTSGSDGSFRYDGLLAGAYDVDARLEDRVGGPVRAHVGSDGKPVTLRLYRGARLEIEVVSAADQKPIPDADVEVRVMHMYEGAATHKGRTGKDGKVQLAGAILVGSEAWASAAGFGDVHQSLDPSAQANGRWQARLELPPGATVSGRVVDDAGMPVAGAIVETANAGGGGQGRGAAIDSRFGNVHPLTALVRRQGVVTDLNGNFKVGLAAGAWRLLATHDKHQTAVSDRLVSDGKTARDGVVLVMPKGVRVRGQVLRTDGQPAAGAQVRVRWQMNGRVEREVRADGDGHFVFPSLPPALLSFQAQTPEASSLPLHLDLEYPPSAPIELKLDNDGVITGTVVDEANNPLPDVDVVYVEHSTSMLMTRVHPSVETTDGAGRFTVHGLSPSAVYSLNAKRAQDGDAAFRVASVEASPGQDVTLHIPGDGSVTGRVVRAGGGSLAGVMVEVVDGGRPGEAVGGDGRFRIDNLFARAYTLRVYAASAAYKNVPFSITSGKVTDVGVVELPRGRHIGGIVRRPDGTPAIGAGVVITVSGDAETVDASADGDGHFSALVPSDASLTVTANDRRFGQSDPLTVAPSDPASDLELKFRPAGTIEGTLTAGGKPLAHRAVVAIAVVDGPAPNAQSGQSDESGYYRIDGLQPGTYNVQLAAGGDSPAAMEPKRVQVVVGEKAFASFELPAR